MSTSTRRSAPRRCAEARRKQESVANGVAGAGALQNENGPHLAGRSVFSQTFQMLPIYSPLP
ncbi:hypothetical protein CO2235_MP90015 [Cupriavidus oxalaticus]|uniref:Uncharacterized protein n=1 Tax=Cupriavidus oxalaticus TaxID=96344 RepID=A0A375GR01_9BURK|nr:hypothetical protein CO2235_MP90015 [Cupriavidus oxalaticus]